ncbi:sedoheptulokinase-like [Chrysoperla carnea]|uniref:sedoheptulokinase-like n=1 Tax=Chrysoperla carnea TaxID=189513 RepID=UPI001D06A776|nr:sedoheptulokinase-like [Chrysoperla carnea]
MSDRQLLLGIDIGTTSVKVCVVDSETKEVIASQQKDTQANVPSDLGTEGNKQDVPKIISAFTACVSRLPKDLLRQVVRIGICGQMHGVMLWNDDGEESRAWSRIEREDNTFIRYDIPREKVSALYTWQDSRCEPSFLATLPKPQSHLKTYTGYGCATLFWMVKNKPSKLEKYNCAGTIQDFVVAMLGNLSKPIMSSQNAASWGYFNCTLSDWNNEILSEADFPVRLLPKVVENGQIVAHLAECWYGIPIGTPIGVALGDWQCSVLATIENISDAILNISTSAQLGFVSENFQPPSDEEEISGDQPTNAVEYLPYFNGKYVIVGASLNGGNCLAAFVKMVQQWCLDLGFSVPQSTLWTKLIGLASEDNAVSTLRVTPTLLGERSKPEQNASVQNIDLSNLGLGQMFRALCRSLIENLHKLLPKELLIESNIQRIVGNGSGLSRNKVLQKEVQDIYQLPLIFTSGGDAARGAALAVAPEQ